MITDADRRMLFDAFSSTMGPDLAAKLMELLPPVGWGDLARQSDLVVLRSDIAQVRGEIGQVRGELRGEMAELRGEMAELRGEMAELRGEMAELRAEMREGFAGLMPKFVLTSLGLATGTAGMVLAVAKLVV